MLECVTSGVPSPNVIWFKNNELIDFEEKSNMRAIQIENRWQLQAIWTEPEDTGRYSCQASNPAGDAIKHFDVSIHGKKSINFIHFFPICFKFLSKRKNK